MNWNIEHIIIHHSSIDIYPTSSFFTQLYNSFNNTRSTFTCCTVYFLFLYLLGILSPVAYRFAVFRNVTLSPTFIDLVEVFDFLVDLLRSTFATAFLELAPFSRVFATTLSTSLIYTHEYNSFSNTRLLPLC